MSRFQLALNVSNLDESIDFYSKLFGAKPAKVRPGYANFALEEPPLKLVLIESENEGGSINHLGVEVFSSKEVLDATERLNAEGFATDVEEQTICCYAVQDKVWVRGPDDSRWEIYTVLEDAASPNGIEGDGRCCVSETSASVHAPSAASCC